MPASARKEYRVYAHNITVVEFEAELSAHNNHGWLLVSHTVCHALDNPLVMFVDSRVYVRSIKTDMP